MLITALTGWRERTTLYNNLALAVRMSKMTSSTEHGKQHSFNGHLPRQRGSFVLMTLYTYQNVCIVKVATILKQLHRKQATSYQAKCRWPSTEIIPGSFGSSNHQQTQDWSYTMHTFLSAVRCNQSEYTTCQCSLTVKHILVEFTESTDICNKYFVFPLILSKKPIL